MMTLKKLQSVNQDQPVSPSSWELATSTTDLTDPLPGLLRTQKIRVDYHHFKTVTFVCLVARSEAAMQKKVDWPVCVSRVQLPQVEDFRLL
ncbi:hypothetical protein EYF80_015955 [Liparis tanakae]|uniref:Uncharacterized protein n=1 Tax=Liparis tanakae TaxID=230148 RepID=A0A4Z2I6T4_9TELE|nr:hypothetical protein EYF80_015955 [Liparis tanakae]